MKKVWIITYHRTVYISLVSLGLELQKRQSAPQNVDVLPTLSINDIDKKVVRVPITQGHIGIFYISIDIYFKKIFLLKGNTYVQLCEQPTNGITYFRCLLNTFELPNELKPYLPLFVNILTKWVKFYFEKILRHKKKTKEKWILVLFKMMVVKVLVDLIHHYN